MTWPEAFATTGMALAVALVVYSICRWGEFPRQTGSGVSLR
ncbi:putative prophage protein [Escherichia coli]|nr:putative prophage protein [Escherichia coli]CAD6098848.1 putative prophage protein [Escherichia coli]CAD6176495.1 putative prophage protein [Escherichia coli]